MHIGRVLLLSLCCATGDVNACSTRERPSDAQLFDRAHEVFVAKVTSTKLARFTSAVCGEDTEECEYVRAEYTLVEPIKGKASRRGHVKDVVLGLGNCSLGVVAGWYYVFYISDEHRSVLHPGGSFAVGPYLKSEQLKELRAISVSPHPRPREEG